jgi:DNA-binding NarL/FixJ family response regulator
MNKNQNLPARKRILLADDDREMLNSLEELLAPTFDIVGKEMNGISAVEAAARLNPDLIVTDLSMPGMGGIEASRRVLAARPDVPIVLLTMHADAHLVDEALKVGIRCYVHKLRAGDELVDAAHCALQGQTFVSPSCRMPGSQTSS